MADKSTVTGLPVPAWMLAVTAMFSVQLAAALSTPLISRVGPAGTAWLRLTAGAVIFLIVARPALSSVQRRDIPALVALGFTTGAMTCLFLAAIARIPLGTAVAVEFLGPLTVAAVYSHKRRALLWPAMALIGVVLLTEIEVIDGDDVAGIGFAAGSAVGWAAYILLTRHVGDRFGGLTGLSLTTPVAAATAATIGTPEALGKIDPAVLLVALGLAVLFPVVTSSLEMTALRHMNHAAFGTLTAFEPAISVLVGLMVLHQHPSPLQGFGIVLVVVAGAAAQRDGRR